MNKVLGYIARCLNESHPINLSFSWWAFWGDPKYATPAMMHKWGYTELSLVEVVTNAGFVEAEIQSPSYHFPDRDMRLVAYNAVTEGQGHE